MWNISVAGANRSETMTALRVALDRDVPMARDRNKIAAAVSAAIDGMPEAMVLSIITVGELHDDGSGNVEVAVNRKPVTAKAPAGKGV